MGTLLLLKEAKEGGEGFASSKDTAPPPIIGHPSAAAVEFSAAERALALEPVEGDLAAFGAAFPLRPGCPHPVKVRLKGGVASVIIVIAIPSYPPASIPERSFWHI